MTVSLITTVLNEVESLGPFIDSLLVQTREPQEIIVVDGGSSDGTIDMLQKISERVPRVRLLVDPTCNINYSTSPVARGRNVAIRAAHGDIIAVTDAGCKLDPHWLEELTGPFSDDRQVDVVGGWYEPWVETRFEKCAAQVTFTVRKE